MEEKHESFFSFLPARRTQGTRTGQPPRRPAEDTDTAAPADRPPPTAAPALTGADPAEADPPAPGRRPGSGEGALASAMRYRAEAQTVPSGGELRLETAELHGEGIRTSGDGGLLLEPGRYLSSFAADAAGETDCGAVFALNGVTLPFTAARHPGDGRLALTAVLDLIGTAILTVENNCGGTVTYRSAVLTAVRLS